MRFQNKGELLTILFVIDLKRSIWLARLEDILKSSVANMMCQKSQVVSEKSNSVNV